jgi:hypothetical protein
MTTFVLPTTPIASLDEYLATDVGGVGVATAQRLGPRATIAAGSTAALAALAALVGHGPTLVAALAIWVTDIAIRAARLLTTTSSSEHV